MILETKRTTYTYPAFVELIEALLAENKTTGTNHSEAYVHYTRMNLQRMNRIYKNTEITEELAGAIGQINGKQTWMILVEAWCGDVAQNLPVIAKAAALNPNIHIELVLRDENLDLMDRYLTNGGRSIPKLVLRDATTGQDLNTWGPRPVPAQKMLMDYKAMAEKPPYSEYVEKIQKWYAKDKTKTLQSELQHTISDANGN